MLLSEKKLSNKFITDSSLESISKNSVNKMKNTLNDYDNVSKEELAELLVNFNLELTRFLFCNFKLFTERFRKLKVILEPYFLLSFCLIYRYFIKELEEEETSKFINDFQPTNLDLVKLVARPFTEETV